MRPGAVGLQDASNEGSRRTSPGALSNAICNVSNVSCVKLQHDATGMVVEFISDDVPDAVWSDCETDVARGTDVSILGVSAPTVLGQPWIPRYCQMQMSCKHLTFVRPKKWWGVRYITQTRQASIKERATTLVVNGRLAPVWTEQVRPDRESCGRDKGSASHRPKLRPEDELLLQ